jgi:chromosome partitioning protein
MATVMVVANQKGGVGKTDLSVNLACYLATMGNRVLLVDLDPQANSTDYLLEGPPKLTSADLLLDPKVALKDVLIKTRFHDNLDIVPSSSGLSAAQVQLANEVDMQFKLKNKLKGIEKYGYVIIDTPPSLGLLTINAFTAANEIIIPIQTHYFALDGVTKLLDTVDRVKQSLNPHLKVRGVVLTMYDRRTYLSKQVGERVRSAFNGKVFNTVIPMNVRLAESPSYHKPIIEYAPTSTGAKAYMELAREFTTWPKA